MQTARWHAIARVGGTTDQFVDDFVRDRANQSLAHVFTLLSLVLPREPLQIAFRGLHSQDRMLRGLALEFLESHLSIGLVSRIRALVEQEQI